MTSLSHGPIFLFNSTPQIFIENKFSWQAEIVTHTQSGKFHPLRGSQHPPHRLAICSFHGNRACLHHWDPVNALKDQGRVMDTRTVELEKGEVWGRAQVFWTPTWDLGTSFGNITILNEHLLNDVFAKEVGKPADTSRNQSCLFRNSLRHRWRKQPLFSPIISYLTDSFIQQMFIEWLLFSKHCPKWWASKTDIVFVLMRVGILFEDIVNTNIYVNTSTYLYINNICKYNI